MAQRLEENLRNHTGANYVHYGVGCDICGAWQAQGCWHDAGVLHGAAPACTQPLGSLLMRGYRVTGLQG